MSSTPTPDYFRTHPREATQLLIFGMSLIWFSLAAVFGLIFYTLLVRVIKLSPSIMLMLFVLMGVINLGMDYVLHQQFSLLDVIQQGIVINISFWKMLFQADAIQVVRMYVTQTLNACMTLGLAFAFFYQITDLLLTNPHQVMMDNLQKGKKQFGAKVNTKHLQKTLDNIDQMRVDGTVIGASLVTAHPVIIPDHILNQVLLVLGTTGGGKSITLRRFYERAAKQGYPMCIVNGKPVDEDVEWLIQLAKKYDRPFYGFNGGNFVAYNPLAEGNYTELKDKIICLKDEWQSEYYRSIAEDYLQTTFAVLLQSKEHINLATVAACLDHKRLLAVVHTIDDASLKQRVKHLASYDKQDISGLQAHLNLLLHSELGAFLSTHDNAFSLKQAFVENAIIHFSLPALKYPHFASVLGKLVINDIKTTIDSAEPQKKVFTIFDEFSIFAGMQSLNLVNMGRGKGVHSIFATQGLAELDQVDPTFKRQLLNCANSIICHRLNDHESAETIANWIGTHAAFSLTAQVNKYTTDAAMGTVKESREFIIHPDEIKQGLKAGEAFYASKIGFIRDKVKIKYS